LNESKRYNSFKSSSSLISYNNIDSSLIAISSLVIPSASARFLSSWKKSNEKILAPPMVYISGEEMTHYCMQRILDRWIRKNVDISNWEFYDLSCKSRDTTQDQVLKDAVKAGKRIGSIFKEPTVTPNETQVKKMGLSKPWGSPNGAMRRGWNGITISRDTIHIKGMELGYKEPVLFDRHAVGGEYSAGWSSVRQGEVKTVWVPRDGSEVVVVDRRQVNDNDSVVVTYDNPLDNVTDLAHHFFSRCLKARIVPYVVTKKTVFKWQSLFWEKMAKVFDDHYRAEYIKTGIIPDGKLKHLISDSATMQIVRWTGGGFGMAAHNYDGDMLTDEIAQVHRSPGFITSNLIGKDDNGRMIKEFEASHGTVTDMWDAHLAGKETSLNPLGLVEALIGAMQYSVERQEGPGKCVAGHPIFDFTTEMREIIHLAMISGKGTRDLCGPDGLTTEEFVDVVGAVLDGSIPKTFLAREVPDAAVEPTLNKHFEELDAEALRRMFDDIDKNEDGVLDYEEFATGLIRLGIAPKTGKGKKKTARDRL